MLNRLPLRTALAAILLATSTALLATACADGAPRAVTSPDIDPLSTLEGQPVSAVKICKTAEKAGTYTFNITKTGGGPGLFPLPATVSITLTADGTDRCTDFFNAANQSSWLTPATFTVTEVVPAGMTSTVSTSLNGSLTTPTVGATGSVTVGFTDNASVEFTNVVAPTPPPTTALGCTPGYWKQSQHFDSWVATGYAPTMLIGSAFSNAGLYSLAGKPFARYTLLDGLQMKGGSGVVGATQILMRAAVSALLNASSSSLNYAYTKSQVVSMVNTALASGNRDAIIIAATKLDIANNARCPLN
jgi:hypothetical protein